MTHTLVNMMNDTFQHHHWTVADRFCCIYMSEAQHPTVCTVEIVEDYVILRKGGKEWGSEYSLDFPNTIIRDIQRMMQDM